jgi:hypothetical protein
MTVDFLSRPDTRHIVVLAEITQVFIQLLDFLLVCLCAFLLESVL